MDIKRLPSLKDYLRTKKLIIIYNIYKIILKMSNKITIINSKDLDGLIDLTTYYKTKTLMHVK
jgi:hypothetical protein